MSTRTKLSSARRIAGVTGAAFAAALVIGACGGGNDTPDGAVENFLDNGVEDFANAMSEGDYDQALEVSEEHFCAADVEEVQAAADEAAAMSEEERAQMQEMMGEAADSIPDDWSYEIGEATEDGDTATVEVEMTDGDETTEDTIDLVKEDDEWRICGF